jgi:hypothetical protein
MTPRRRKSRRRRRARYRAWKRLSPELRETLRSGVRIVRYSCAKLKLWGAADAVSNGTNDIICKDEIECPCASS